MANDPQKTLSTDDLVILVSIVVVVLFVFIELGTDAATLFVR
jgi:hypothetical protein